MNDQDVPEGKISKAIRWVIGIVLIGLAFWIGIHLPMQANGMFDTRV